MGERPLLFPEDARYDCSSCGKCCRTQWTIPVTPEAQRLIEPSALFRRVRERIGDDPIHVTEVLGRPQVVARTTPDGCAFLEGSLCGVHKELGHASKPLGCRIFPFEVVETPEAFVVGLSFYCNAVQRRQGGPASEHAAAVARMIGEHAPRRVGFEPIVWTPGVRVSFAAYEAFERLAREDAMDLGHGLFRLLTTAAKLAVSLTEHEAATPDGTVPDAAFLSALGAARASRVRPDRLFFELEALLVATLQTKLEVDRDLERTRQNHRALLEGGTFESARHGRVDVGELVAWRMRLGTGDRDAEELRRYVANLLHRKYLATRTSVVDGAAGLYLALRLVELNRDIAAFVRGAERPETSDVHAGLDAVETGFTFHADGLDPIVAELGRSYVDQLRAAGTP